VATATVVLAAALLAATLFAATLLAATLFAATAVVAAAAMVVTARHVATTGGLTAAAAFEQIEGKRLRSTTQHTDGQHGGQNAIHHGRGSSKA
jgi:hypothetical protein